MISDFSSAVAKDLKLTVCLNAAQLLVTPIRAHQIQPALPNVKIQRMGADSIEHLPIDVPAADLER
jgi:hypothetical protein